MSPPSAAESGAAAAGPAAAPNATAQTPPPAAAAAAPEEPEQQQRRTIICLGDSHTRGFYGASWLRLLRAKYPQLRFVNAGNDGEPSAAILARLPALLEAHPDPVAVTILTGSNDCIAQASATMQRWYAWQFKLTQPCSEQGALDNAAAMVQMVQDKAPSAKIIVINLPIMVEHPAHPANRRAQQYSDALVALMRSRFPSVAVVDFQAACRAHMAQHSPQWRQALEQEQQPGVEAEQAAAGANADPSVSSSTSSASSSSGGGGASSSVGLSPLSLARHMLWSKFLQGWLLGKGWDSISGQQGLVLLTDNIHINDTAAGLLAGLLEPQLAQLAT